VNGARGPEFRFDTISGKLEIPLHHPRQMFQALILSGTLEGKIQILGEESQAIEESESRSALKRQAANAPASCADLRMCA